MSPGNQGVFQALERGGFSKNFGILQLAKMGLYLGVVSGQFSASESLVGSVQKGLSAEVLHCSI